MPCVLFYLEMISAPHNFFKLQKHHVAMETILSKKEQHREKETVSLPSGFSFITEFHVNPVVSLLYGNASRLFHIKEVKSYHTYNSAI